MAAAEPLRVISASIDASANAARIFAQHRAALEILEGEVATDILLYTRHSIANACTAPASSRTAGSHLRRAGRQRSSVLKGRGNLERDDFGKGLDESGRRTGCERQSFQIMVVDYNNDGQRIDSEVANRRNCDARERAIEVPMLEPMWIARDDRGFIAVHVVGVVAVTVRVMMIAVVMFVMVMVRIFGAIMTMNVRIVSPAMPMMNDAHDARCLVPSQNLICSD